MTIYSAAMPGNLMAQRSELELRPMVQQYCGQCHIGRARGGINFTNRTSENELAKDPTFWHRVLGSLEDRSMPADIEPTEFTEVHRQKMVRLIRNGMRNPDLSKIAPDPGPVLLRRLSAYQYATSVRDLLGVTVPLEKLPADDDLFVQSNAGANGGLSSVSVRRYMAIAEDAVDRAPRERIVLVEPRADLPKREAAKQVMEKLQPRAFRRPVPPDDMERSLKLFDVVDSSGQPYDEALKVTMIGVLSSPAFLLHIEQNRPGTGAQRVESYEQASRLSYFLWSSIPDEELFKLAAEGKLADDAVIEQQVRRMLKDPRAKALAENFGVQWLGLQKLLTPVRTTRPLLADDTDAMRQALRDQAVAFLDSVFREDVSLVTLFNADYVFVNELLAKRDGMTGVEGSEMRRVPAPQNRSGGVLALGAVHTATSTRHRTSPVLRGKWVTSTLFGEVASPPIYRVCQISREENAPEGAALRTAMEVNRRKEGCAVCHERLDPPGLAMENFGPMGEWRTTIKGEPIVQTTTMDDLRKSMVARKDLVIRTLAERMLGFALGRAIEPIDQPTVKKVCDAVAASDDRVSAMVVEIAKSLPFTHRRPVNPE